ncbi:hypothetical protein O181_018959 [Austropuccinia psidii MF-1]|uniref:Uncharacterized protein n=1 Tax=Austropuccinia psidii MF-1 TaxID=1389203 RepID=A0A9Q3GU94_9BASI|nr:hypothetical protein [Austropuccinia psidii MF-1]
MLEKGWKPRLPADTLRKDLYEIHPIASSFKIMLDKLKPHAKQIINEDFDFEKQEWDASHKVPDFKIGDLVLVSTLMELSGALENKHPTLPVRLINPYQPDEKELFCLSNPTPLTVQQVEQSEDKKINKFNKERSPRGNNQREYLFRYINPLHEDQWLAESEIPESDQLLRRLRHERRTQA